MTTSDGRRRPDRAAMWMLGGAAAFAVMGACAHALGGRCDWLVTGLVRAVFMFAAIAGWARASGVRLVVWEPPTLWLRSLAGSFSLVCNFYALVHLPVADAITLANTHPLWIVLATALLLRQPPTAAEAAGVVSGLLGVALIERPHLDGDALAAAVALVSSVSTAVAMLGLHRLRHVDPRAIVAHFAGVAILVSAAGVALRPGALAATHNDAATWLLLLGVGVTGTVGQFCLTRAYASGPPSKVAAIGLTQVVFAMGLEALIWGRDLTPSTLLGFALVLAPVAWLSGRVGRALVAVGTAERGDGRAPEPAARR